MKITTLVENTSTAGLPGEWGLCLHIVYHGRSYLLDTGGSDLFLRNAETLGVSIEDVDCAVLSHAHSDHAGGMSAFFEHNAKAAFHIAGEAAENCYGKLGFFKRYEGIPHGVLTGYSSRMERHREAAEIADGVYIVPHRTAGLAAIGRKAHLYAMIDGRLVADDFRHEISLVFDTPEGLVLLNSCSHAGADAILAEVERAIPHRPVYAYIGGLHLFNTRKRAVIRYGKRLQQLAIPAIYTGHCTGQRSYSLLQTVLGDHLHPLTTGSVIELAE